MEEKKVLNIYQRMLKITNELGYVSKNLKVSMGKGSYKAAGETDILKAVKPLEDKYGVYSYPVERKLIETTRIENTYGNLQQFMRMEITYRFVNTDLPTEYIDITSYGDGIDNGDKAPGKAMTYGDKYALMKAYKISTGDDPDAKASEKYRKTLNNEQKEQKESVAKELKKFGINIEDEAVDGWIASKMRNDSFDEYLKVANELIKIKKENMKKESLV